MGPENINKGNKRTEERYSVRMKIEYLTDGADCKEKGQGPRETFTTDISFNGMGLYSDCLIEKGQTIEIFLRHVYKKPIIAEVKWNSKLSDNLYRLGVQYLNPLPLNIIASTNTQ